MHRSLGVDDMGTIMDDIDAIVSGGRRRSPIHAGSIAEAPG